MVTGSGGGLRETHRCSDCCTAHGVPYGDCRRDSIETKRRRLSLDSRAEEAFSDFVTGDVEGPRVKELMVGGPHAVLAVSGSELLHRSLSRTWLLQFASHCLEMTLTSQYRLLDAPREVWDPQRTIDGEA